MNLPHTIVLLNTAAPVTIPWFSTNVGFWILLMLILVVASVGLFWVAKLLLGDSALPPAPKVIRKPLQSRDRDSAARGRPPEAAEPKPNNISSLLDVPAPPPAGTPVLTQVSATTQPSRASGGQGAKVIEEWTGDSALRGDFKDIMGALGKKLDEALTQSKAHQELVDQLKSQNAKLAEEKAQLLDLLNNDKHRKLLLKLVAVIKLCNRSLPHVTDNAKATEFINLIRDECADRLNEAGLSKYSPEPGTPLSKLDGSLVERSPRSEPTPDPAKNDTVFQIIVPGYYHERDGKKSAVAKAEVVFYKHSSDSNPNPAA